MALDNAKNILRELLYKTRENAHSRAMPGAGSGLCGLGDPAEVFKEMDNVLRPSLESLFSGKDAGKQQQVNDLVGSWLREQDALDRERNHFLKKFRNEHGFDRRQYSAELAKSFDAGLDEVNERQNRTLEACAAELVRLLGK